MYQRFYELSDSPFELTYNSKFVFYSASARQVVTHLENGLLSARPITVLLGAPGTGKTTLLRAALQSARCRHVQCVSLKNPTLTREELIETLVAEFALGPRAVSSKTALFHELQSALCERRARGMATALVIDEAEHLSDDLYDELRRLANMEAAHVTLLPLILAGQSELATRLDEPGLRYFMQRVSMRCEVAPFRLSQTADYIVWRVHAAGSQAGALFTREAVVLIHELSGGVARTINVICDNVLLIGFARKLKPVTRDLVQQVCRDLDLDDAPQSEPSPRDHAAASSYM